MFLPVLNYMISTLRLGVLHHNYLQRAEKEPKKKLMENYSLLLLIIIFDLLRDAAVSPIAFMTAINFK